ncbi:hypothetical protein K3495_g17033, partial [Podosphaera aphanis]
MSRCPELELAQALVKRYHEYRAEIKYNRKHRSERPRGGSNDETKPRSKFKNSKAYPAHELGNEAETSSASSSEEDSDIAAHEVCCLSKEQLSKASPSVWPADTGASSHMSDQPSLFRFLTPIPRRRVQVGGGELEASHKGDAILECRDGSCMILHDV